MGQLQDVGDRPKEKKLVDVGEHKKKVRKRINFERGIRLLGRLESGDVNGWSSDGRETAEI